MAPLRPIRLFSARVLGFGVGALLLVGCNAVEVRAWNLSELHGPTGRPKYSGRLRTKRTYDVYRVLTATGFKSQSINPARPEAIEDPLGECLDNLIALGDLDPDGPRKRAVMIEYFSWLGVLCTYSLSRERCAMHLGHLGALVLATPIRVDEEDEFADATEVGGALTRLIEASRPFLEGRGGAAETEALAEVCRDAGRLDLDIQGTKRMLSAATLILVRTGFDDRRLAPLRELHLDLERRAVGLALGALSQDEVGHARAAGVLACVQATGNRAPEILAEAFEARDPEVRTAAAEAIRLYGFPQPAPDADETARAASEAEWTQRLIDLLMTSRDGTIGVAACHALARVTGRPPSLRPEEWIIWWEEERAGRGNPPVPAGAEAAGPGEPADDPR